MNASTAPILETSGLGKTFGGGRTLLGARKPQVHAVRDVTLAVAPGETLGVVGESGCGKSTLARMLVGLVPPTSGTIALDGQALTDAAKAGPRAFGRTIQYVFQDPTSALNPRKTIRQILEAPLIHLIEADAPARERRVAELMDIVSLRPEFLERYPHEFSGGQAQRIGIARALAAEPRIVVLDEPVSALDVSVQAQVLNLLSDLRTRLGLTYLFISHDLAVVEAIAERVAVMYFGRVVETGPVDEVFRAPRHPYTRLLLSSAPAIGARAEASDAPQAELPDPTRPPPGCAFAGRCPNVRDDCRTAPPPLVPMGRGRAAACLHPLPAEGADGPA
ncbi:ABC transporter ATP-binding protein [Salinarimonas ramus]|uniref:ABC transporter ATP-binding protein n=1 Tax=Salinarimonas ramus TaxID=690164 RepID=A0A917Q6B1_9HYPH|nr:oligopeptide/dipeptide ABC transporter ATP-binding protein [Salinarimonas ramus]GGK22061.1 ABC transporter ATP-binding protein [Salinarimonas ramus]